MRTHTAKRSAHCILIAVLTAFLPLKAVADVRLMDDTEREVLLSRPAQRIVSLSPHLTELVFAVGGGGQLVGTVSFSDYPEAANDIPRIGSYNTINYEAIVQMQPDLVLAWGSGNGEEKISKLKSLGLTVYISEPKILEDVALSLQKIGILVGNKDQGNDEAENFLKRLTKLKKNYSNQSQVSVFYQLSSEPIMTLSGRHLISDVVALCGGRNVFAEALPIALKANKESLLRSNPQVVIAGAEKKNQLAWLDRWKRLSSITAVQNGHIYFIHPDLLSRHTPRIIDGAEKMCNFLAKVRNQKKETER